MNERFPEGYTAPAQSPQGEPVPQPQPVRIAMPSLAPTATYIILGFTVLIYLLQMASMAMLGDDLPIMLGARVNELILKGQWWRFLTPVFLHGSMTHIFFNMYALFVIGSFLERHFGHRRFLLLYFRYFGMQTVSYKVFPHTRAIICLATDVVSMLSTRDISLASGQRCWNCSKYSGRITITAKR